ncbi:MAG: NADH-quinone oxidoreductase subunit J [Bacteroidetes bacterium]|nr:MAG: NADH-quinone oxidoreductase subunit J [Bacteroidota bacterium]
MTITHILFLVLSVVAVLSAAIVVLNSNPVRNVLLLIVCFFSIAGHYVLLNAQFLAAVHVIVYAGAIMVLFLFVIMLLNLNKESEPHKPAWEKIIAVIAGGIFFVTLVGALKGTDVIVRNASGTSLGDSGIPSPEIGLVESLGKVLFSDFLVPFELSSILFLGAMVGAVMLGKKNIK